MICAFPVAAQDTQHPPEFSETLKASSIQRTTYQSVSLCIQKCKANSFLHADVELMTVKNNSQSAIFMLFNKIYETSIFILILLMDDLISLLSI